MDDLLIKKLRFRQQSRTLVLNAPAGYVEKLGEENVKTVLEKNGNNRAERFDFVQVFVHNPQEINDLSFSILKFMKYDAIFWISFPKEITKPIEKTIEAIRNAGFENVAHVALDETWSAIRFRPEGVVV